jgi:SSS family solute:Na+ symporter
MRVGTILYLLALTLHAAVGWNMVATIVITGGAIMIYSLAGGLRAVVWTDAIQGLLLIAGILLSIGFIFMKMPEGPGQLFRMALDRGKMSLGSMGPDLSESTFWVVLVYGIFINLQNFGIDQNYIQRYMASRSDHAAGRSALWGGMLYIPVSLLFLLTGTGLYTFYASGAATLPEHLQDPALADQIFPYFIVNQLPVGITGLLLASIFAAGMSTISTSFNSSSTVFLTDFYRPFKGGKTGEKEAMKVLYMATATITLIAVGIALAMINVRSALDTWWKLASVFSGGMLGLFLLGAFSRRSRNPEAIAGVSTGVAVIAWLSLSSLTRDPAQYGNVFHTYLTIVMGTVAIFLVGFLLSLLGRRRS